MYSIKETITNTYMIRKSKFITYLYRIRDIDEIKAILKQLKSEYKDATHVCYGYILGSLEKCSDDKEPSGTAGLPILNVLKMNNLTYTLCVVIRYFGGIKLGASGLTRAYSTAVIQAINKSTIIKLIEGYLVEMEFDYSQTKLVDYMLNNKQIIDKRYDHHIIYQFYLNKEELDLIPKLEKVASHISIKDQIMIEK